MKTTQPSISKNHRLFFVALMVALFSVTSANAATTYYAIANGNWNVNTNWSLSSGGPAVAIGFWPVAGDDVYIGEGGTLHSITVPAAFTAACANIYMGVATSGIAATLTLAASTSALHVSGNVIVYGPNAASNRFINVNDGNMTVSGNLELGNGQTGNLANRVCKVVITTGMATVGGNLVFNNIAGSSPLQTQIVMSGGTATFNLARAFTINNNSGTLTAGTTSTFNFNGTATGQTIPVGVSSVIYNHLHINNTHSAGATISTTVSATNVTGNLSVQSGSLNNGAFEITLAPGKSFSVANGAFFKLTGTTGMVSVSGGGTRTFGPTSTVNYAGTIQAVTAELYGHIIFSGIGTKTMAAGNTSVAGNWTNNGTVDALTNAGATTFCCATGMQNIGGSSVTSFFDIFLNNASGAQLGNDAKVINSFTLTSGILTTGLFTLDVTNNAPGAISSASASDYISGNMQRAIAAGVNSYDFPIGTAAAYAPVTIDFTAGTLAGILAARTSDGDHANIGPSFFSPTRTVNRTWSFNITSGLATANYDATFNWAGTDQDGGFDYTTAFAGKYTGGTWSYPAMGTLLATSAGITGESGFSDFQIGNSCLTLPTATISGSQYFCAGIETDLTVTLTGTPNWSYTWSDGTNTGTVTGVTSTSSTFPASPIANTTYTIVSVSDGSGCNAPGSGSATLNIGPVTTADNVFGCVGEIVEVPVIVSNFNDIGAISLTLKYNKDVLLYQSYDDSHSMIGYAYSEEIGSFGVVRFSGIADDFFSLSDGETLVTLNFLYRGGYTDLVWDNSDDTWCEYASGAPDFIPYCDDNTAIYYIAGSVTDGSVTADFSATDVTPPTNTDVTLNDLSTGASVISWEWSFDPPTVDFVNGTDLNDQNPDVQFTDGGLYTVTLTVHSEHCVATTEKIDYIHAGLPGVWDGPTSTDWYTSTNWDDHVVPTAPTDVIIPTRPALTHFYPHVLGDLTVGTHCNSITLTGLGELRVDGVLTVSPGKTLDIQDDATVHATGF